MLVSSRLRAILTSAAVVVAGVVVAPPAQAAGEVTWTGAASELWSDPQNWGGVGPVTGDDLRFTSSATRKATTNDLPPGTAFDDLILRDSGYDVSGDPITTSEVSAAYSSGVSTIATDLVLTGGVVVLSGGGTLALKGAVSAPGMLVVAGVGGGSVQVDGVLSAPVAFSGAALSGSGTLTGEMMGAPSTLSPGPAGGAGVGTLTYTSPSSLRMSPQSTLRIDIDGPTAGSGYDQLRLTDGSALFNPDGAPLDVDLGYVPAVNTSFQIVSQSTADPIAGRFNGISQFGSFTTHGVTFSVGYFSSGVVLTVVAVDVPTSNIVVNDSTLLAGETSPVTITFSEPVTGFDNSDLSVANGTLSDVESTDGVTWTATLTPTDAVDDASNVITLDNAGVTNASAVTGLGTTSSGNYAVSTVRPTASSIVLADTVLVAGETSGITFTFSEAVTGLTVADLTIPNGTVSTPTTGDGGTTWTATFTPTDSIDDPTNVITLDNAGVEDLAGNAGVGNTESNNYELSTKRPTATIVFTDSALAIGQTSLVTITFSEAVTGFTLADMTVQNGSISGLSTSDNIVYTMTFVPAAGIDDPSNVVTLNKAGVTDLAGNTGSGTTDSGNYSLDRTRPTAAIVVADNDLRAGETSLVTITFSEPVTGLANIDLAVANGTLSAPATSDGGVTWTATLTPTASVTDASNVIALDNTGVTDVAGNAETGTTASNNYAIDTVPAPPRDDVAPASVATGPTYSADPSWTIGYTASDASSGVASVDLYVRAPGDATYAKVASDSTTQDGEFSYTGTVDGTYEFRTVATDHAGNVETGPVSPDSSTVLDTTVPSSQSEGPGLLRTRTWTITYTAADATSGVASVDLFVQAPGETTYTEVASDSSTQDGEFTYTGATDGTYRFRTVATDRAGNVETTDGAPDSVTTLDTRAPLLESAMGSAPVTFRLSAGRPLALRFRVDEAVSATFRITQRGETVRSFGTRTSTAGVLKQLWRGGTDAGSRVRPGRYRVVLSAQDLAGNVSRASVPLRVRR